VGAVQLTGSFPDRLEVTVTPVGAPGVVAGVPLAEVEAGLVPAALVAVTVTVYVTPFVRDGTVQLVLGAVAVQAWVVCPVAAAEAV
jgi:hypothetical protein